MGFQYIPCLNIIVKLNSRAVIFRQVYCFILHFMISLFVWSIFDCSFSSILNAANPEKNLILNQIKIDLIIALLLSSIGQVLSQIQNLSNLTPIIFRSNKLTFICMKICCRNVEDMCSSHRSSNQMCYSEYTQCDTKLGFHSKITLLFSQQNKFIV